MEPMIKRSVTVTRRALRDEDDPLKDHALLTIDERIALVWDLTAQAWQLQGKNADEFRLSRHIVHLRRLGE